MKVRVVHVAVAGAVVMALAVVLLPLLGHPWVFSMRKAVDVHSGDVMEQTYICGLRVAGHIHDTPFSRELRRVNVNITNTRRWERLGADVLIGRPVSYRTQAAVLDCNFLIRLLDELSLPDHERVPLLEEARRYLENKQLKPLHNLLQNCANQLWEKAPTEPPREGRIAPSTVAQ